MKPAYYRKTLLAKKAEALANLGIKFETLAAMGPMAEEDQAQIRHDEFVSVHVNSLDHQKLRMIDEALDRIEAGEFGVCAECGEALPARRLEAIPWARYCVRCQEREASGQAEWEGDALVA